MSESSLNTAAGQIRLEIERNGPIPFARFMEVALYAPETGYYMRPPDPFGPPGDFFTAEQLQPVFGILIAQFARSVHQRMRAPADFSVVELGAGRGEMAEALARFGYTPVDVARGELPQQVTGLIFANEFFDALPVFVAIRRGGTFVTQSVGFSDGRFVFIEGEPASGEIRAYLDRYYGHAEEGATVEVHLRGLEWLDRIADTLTGWLVIIDYGYTAREWIRHTAGTLMSYRRHIATEDVLNDPGNQDITAHVPFTVFEAHLKERGFRIESFETLASFLLKTGEPDHFEAALAAENEKEAVRRRMQLKTLLFSMGETFRVLVASKTVTQ